MRKDTTKMLKRILIALLCACTLTTAMVSCDHSKINESKETESQGQSTENSENNELTAEEALEIAKEYWKDHDIEKNGYIIAEAVNKTAPESVYVFVMKHLVTIEGSSHYSTIDEVWVDKITGEATPPYDATEKNELTAEEALEIAKEYWKDHDVEKNGFLIAEAVSRSAPDTVYVFVLKHLVEIGDSSYYSTIDEVWVDKLTGEAMPPYEAKPGLMFDYDEVLWCYKYAVDYYNYERGDTVDDVIADFNTKYGKGFLNETEKQWFADIATSGYILYPGKRGDDRIENNHACGYAIKDLNGDGVEELVLLNVNYYVVAIFSMKDGRPILLDHFGNRKECKIDGNGYVVVSGSSAADVHSTVFYRIAEGGGSLEPLFEYGLDGHEWVDGEAVIKYYKTENGVKTYITLDEYNSLCKGHGEYYGHKTDIQVTEEDSGLQFRTLFGEPFTFSTYGNIVAAMRFMTGMYNNYKLGIAERENFEYRFDLSTEYNREMYEKLDKLVRDWYPPALGGSFSPENAFAYAIKDLNGDGVDELVLIDGERIDAFAVMTKKDGKIEIYDTAYSFDRPAGEKSYQLYYWKNTVGLDLFPLYRDSDYFSLDALRLEARYMIESALVGGELSDVWVPLAKEHIQLADYVAMTPSGEKRLGDIKDLKYAFVNMDNDGIEELLIDCGAELVVLHKSFGSVYLYSFDHRQISSLNADGSFSWNHTGNDFEYGESRITWLTPAGTAEIEMIWRISGDGEPDAEYYIGETQVTQEEIQQYFAENPKTRVEFMPLEEIYGDRVSPLEALNIGREYWQRQLPEESLSVIISYYAQFDNVPFDTLDEKYIVQLVKRDSEGLIHYVEEIIVDRATGGYIVTSGK